MLIEMPNVRQTEGRQRRWFRSAHEELIVWFSDDGSIWGFQLCYDRDREEKALTWRRGHGYTHERIDDGESPGISYKQTPILVQDGAFDARAGLECFLEVSAALPKFIADFVSARIRGYGGDAEART
jgi:hypothetical protein